MDRRNQTIEALSGSTRSVLSATPVLRGAGPRAASDGGAYHAARSELAAWLVAGRVARGLTREQIAQVTRIQMRTIERLEGGRFEELPADVFVRGFLRNYARCVGLSVDEAFARYGGCGFAAAPVTAPSVQAIALLDSMATLAGHSASVTVVPSSTPRMLLAQPERDLAAGSGAITDGAVALETCATASGPVDAHAIANRSSARRRSSGRVPARGRDAKGRFIRGAGSDSAAVDVASPIERIAADLIGHPEDADASAASSWESDRPVIAIDAVAPSVTTATPARGVTLVTAPPPIVLMIDDDDPERAEREREQRAKDTDGGGWRSFLPPVLLEQGRNRQGGLTLAVIILLIVATLTLSYLMRRPSSTGEGVTTIPAHSSLIA